MSLITCSECGYQYSDRANSCPNCACPNPCADYTNPSTTKSRFNHRPFIKFIVILALSVVVIGYIYKIYMYHCGLNAMGIGDYSTARNYLEELNYKDSKLIMNDISFLEDLEKIVRMELSYDSEMEYIMNSAEGNLKKLRQYKAVEFYTDDLDSLVDRYIEGLERITDAFEYESAASIQYELLAGKYYCDSVVVSLHNGLGFMQNNSKYSEVYNNIIPKDEAMLTALEKLSEKGHVTTQNGEFWYNQINLYLRNDTEYSFTQTYIFNFYDYNGGKLLETVTVDVSKVEPYTDYKVCIDVPQSARNGYSVDYSYYIGDVDIPN